MLTPATPLKRSTVQNTDAHQPHLSNGPPYKVQIHTSRTPQTVHRTTHICTPAAHLKRSTVQHTDAHQPHLSNGPPYNTQMHTSRTPQTVHRTTHRCTPAAHPKRSTVQHTDAHQFQSKHNIAPQNVTMLKMYKFLVPEQLVS